ncbi:MAG: site-specific integrase, partial [Ignavibacteriae bacterium]|nr:site-specific integrase [Ignavibacteriota bacterium]
MKQIENNTDKDFKNMIRFSYLTGVRISELINLQIKDIENGVINVLNKDNFTTKSKKYRIIPINKEIQEVLNTILGKSDSNVLLFLNPENYLFNKKKFRLNRVNVSNKFRCIIKKLKLNPNYHWHCLRATFIMNLV